MSDSTTSSQDPLWDAAWSWVIRQHDHTNFNAAAAAELQRWLAADPAHPRVYQQAGRLWLAAGLVPPVHAVAIADAQCQKD